MTSTDMNADASVVGTNASTSASTRMSTSTRPMVAMSSVGGAEMFGNRNIIQNAVNSPIHTTLVAAVKQADLVETLSGPGPFTVFAPTDEAFGLIPADTVNALMMPAAKAQLANLLTYHVVPGRITAKDIMAKAKANAGVATYATVQGGTLRFVPQANGTILIEGNRGKAYVTQADVMQSNGVIHVINGILLP